MIELLDFIFLGLGTGALYGLIALPLSLVYTTTNCIDLGVGGYAVLGGVIAAAFTGPLGVVIGLVTGVALGAIMGAIYRALEARGNKDHITPTLGSLGLVTAIASFVLWRFGTDPSYHQAFSTRWHVAGLTISPQLALNGGVVALLLMSSLVVIYKTPVGRIMRACASNPADSQLVGIPIGMVQLMVFAIGGLLSAGAGVLFVMTRGVSFDYALPLSLSAFGALIIFGMRGPITAVAGGLTLGVVEGLSAGYLSSSISVIVPLAFILVVLASNSTHVARAERA